MKHLFVPYELAFKLKEKGFEEPCLKSINETGFENDYSVLGAENWNKLQFVVSIPMYQQVVDWFYDNHEILIVQIPSYSMKVWEVSKKGNKDVISGLSINKAIEEAIKLIK